jgi:hypothetical protein
VRDSLHIPLHELTDRIDGVLDRPGRDVVLINDSYEAAGAAGLEEKNPAEEAGPLTS